MTRIRNNLTYANVMSTLAVIIALAGGSTAIALSAGKNTVTTKSIRNGNVTAKDLAEVRVVSASGEGSATALCRPGEDRVGGGGLAQSGLGRSHPVDRGWMVVEFPESNPVTAYALCLGAKVD